MSSYYLPRGTLFQPLLDCAGPVPPSASVVYIHFNGRSFSFTCCCCLRAWGLYPLPRASSVPIRGKLIQFHNLSMLKCVGPVPPSLGVVCTDPRGTLFQPLFDCAGPVPPSASFVCTDLTGRPFSFACCCCLSARGLYPLPRASSVPIPAERFFHRYLSVRSLYPFRERRQYRPHGTFIQFHILLLLECVGPVPPSAGVACTDPRGTVFKPLLECAGPVPPSASVVCTDLAGRSFSFTILSMLECVEPVPPSAGVVCTDPRDSFQPLLECAGPESPSASVVCTDLAERSFSFTILSLLECMGPRPPSACIVCPNPRGAFFQPLLECVGPVSPSASVVDTDLVVHPFSFTCCCCLSAWGCTPFRELRL